MNIEIEVGFCTFRTLCKLVLDRIYCFTFKSLRIGAIYVLLQVLYTTISFYYLELYLLNQMFSEYLYVILIFWTHFNLANGKNIDLNCKSGIIS